MLFSPDGNIYFCQTDKRCFHEKKTRRSLEYRVELVGGYAIAKQESQLGS